MFIESAYLLLLLICILWITPPHSPHPHPHHYHKKQNKTKRDIVIICRPTCSINIKASALAIETPITVEY